MRRSKYNATSAVAAKGTVTMDAAAFATDCAIVSALALSLELRAHATSAVSPVVSARTSSWLSHTTPKAVQNLTLVRLNDRPSDAKTPRPSRMSAGTATDHAACSQNPGTKQKKNPIVVATVTTMVSPTRGRNRRHVSRTATFVSVDLPT